MKRAAPWLSAAAAFVAFSPALFARFVGWDDPELVTQNPALALDGAGLKAMFTSFQLAAYVPLTMLSLALDKAVWGLKPFGFHLTNLLLHAFNAVLVFRLARRLLKDDRAALAAALLFGVHPLRAESVCWISERKDVLSGAFYLLTAELYLAGKARAALAAFGAGLLSKASGVGLPLVLWLLDRDSKKVAPFLGLSLAAGVIGLAGQEAASQGLSWAQKAALAVYGAAFYVRKTLLPFGLGPIYEIPPDFSWSWPPVLGSLALCAALAAAAWRRPGLRRPLAAYVLLAAPMLGLVQFGGALAADRYSYLACVPLALVLARFKPALWAAPLLLVLSLRQAGFWRETESLWTRGVEVWPRSAVAHSNLAFAKAEAGDLNGALALCDKALALDPGLWHAHDNRGAALLTLGRTEEAVVSFDRAHSLKPSGQTRRHLALAWFNWGNAAAREGSAEEARRRWERTLELEPGYAPAERNLAWLTGAGRTPARRSR